MITRHRLSLHLCLFLVAALNTLGLGSSLPQKPLQTIKPLNHLDVIPSQLALSTFTGCGGQFAAQINPAYEQAIVDLVNQERSNRSLPPLKRNSELDAAARYHAADLGQDDYFDHDTYDRSGSRLIYICDTWERIVTYYFGARGENIAAGYATPEAAMNAWMNSSGHRANILSAGSWEIGVGFFEGAGEYSRYWVQDFGKQAGVFPLIINNDAATTDSRSVSLYIYGAWDQIRLRNDNEPWSTWMAFQNSLAWELPNTLGAHTVHAEMRTSTTSAASQDGIELTHLEQFPELGNLPASLHFFYSLENQQLQPPAVSLTPANIGSPDPLSWEILSNGDWFTATPLTGVTPESFTITPTGFLTTTPQLYTGIITVTVYAPPDVIGAPHQIILSLEVISATLKQVFLPSLATR